MIFISDPRTSTDLHVECHQKEEKEENLKRIESQQNYPKRT